MARTLVSSATREWVIAPDAPFTLIGERLNPTNRPTFQEELAAKNYTRVERDTIAQVEAGVQMLDVNAGIPPHMGSEADILCDMIRLVQSLTDLPLAIDSSIIEALEAGLAVYQGRPLVNSVTGEDESLERVLPLVKKYDAAVVAISNDETGISPDPNLRYAVAKKIVERAQDHGIPKDQVVVDPLVMPLGATPEGAERTYAVQAFEVVQRLHRELEVNTTCGLSNVSFGLPNRHALNGTFLTMAAGFGMTSAILNPLHEPEMMAAKAADAMMGKDANCAQWIKAYREPAPAGADGGAGAGRRRGGNRRRQG